MPAGWWWVNMRLLNGTESFCWASQKRERSIYKRKSEQKIYMNVYKYLYIYMESCRQEKHDEQGPRDTVRTAGHFGAGPLKR